MRVAHRRTPTLSSPSHTRRCLMYVLVVQVALIASWDLPQSAAQGGEMIGLPVGTWQVLDLVDGSGSSRDDKIVQITGSQLLLTGGEDKQEFRIVGIDSTTI